MINGLKRFFSPPVFKDEDKIYQARILNIILLVLMPTAVLAALNMLFVLNDQSLSRAVLISVGFVLLSWALLRFKYLTPSILLLLGTILGIFTFTMYITNGIHSIELLGFAVTMAITGLLLGGRWPLFFALASFLILGGVTYAEVNGIIVTPFSDLIGYGEWVNIGILLFILGFLQQLTIGNLTRSLRRARLNENALDQSNRQLQTIRESLEAQVEARTAGLAAVAALGERLNTLLDLEVVLSELVNLVQEQFGYYHVHIYLLDQDAQNDVGRLIMAAGTGAVGAEMKAQGHSIPLSSSTSLVARAARQGEIVRVEEVRETSDWLPNPLLPDTHAEMAVPIILDNEVMGVLDVQSDQIGGLDESDAYLLRSLVNQVAVALRNARLFSETQAALSEAQGIQARYQTRAWSQYRQRQKVLQAMARASRTSLDSEEVEAVQPKTGQPERVEPYLNILKRNALEGAQTVKIDGGGQGAIQRGGAGQGPTLVTALRLGDQVIGTLGVRDGERSRRWTEDDVALVEAIAQQVAQALENARLFDQVQARAAREQLTREITDRMRSVPDVESIIQTGLGELADALGVSRSYVKLSLEENSQTIQERQD